MTEKNTTSLDRLGSGMKVVAACCLMGMAVVTGIDVIGRGVLNTPLYGSEEIVSILAVLVAGFALPYAHAQGSHIGVEILVRRFGRKVRQRIKLITDLTAFGFFAVVSWRMVLYGLGLKKSGTVSMNLALPTYYVIFALAAGFAVYALFLLRDVLRIARGKE